VPPTFRLRPNSPEWPSENEFAFLTMALSWLWGTSQLDEAVGASRTQAGETELTGTQTRRPRSSFQRAQKTSRSILKYATRFDPRVHPHETQCALSNGGLITRTQMCSYSRSGCVVPLFVASHSDRAQLTDTCVKNGGDHFLVEIASRDFIDNIVSILRVPGLNHAVKSAILQHIQNWALAFDGKPNLAYVGQIYKTLKSDGASLHRLPKFN